MLYLHTCIYKVMYIVSYGIFMSTGIVSVISGCICSHLSIKLLYSVV